MICICIIIKFSILMNNQLDLNNTSMDVNSRSGNSGNGDTLHSIRPIIARPITQTQVNAMRAGSYVHPGNSLADFFKNLENYHPAIPDSVALYYMRKNGIQNSDPRIVRLFSLAAQKFVSDIALDAMQQARIKGLGQIRKGTRETRFTLTSELLNEVLKEYGITMDLPPYYQ